MRPDLFKYEAAPLAIRAGLEPYTAPLDHRRAAHLLRRAHFGATPEAIAALVGRTASDVVAELMAAAQDVPPQETPPWIDDAPPREGAPVAEREQYVAENLERLLGLQAQWVERLATYGLRERLALFWHDHFVTEVDAYFLAPFAFRYLDLLRTHALGDFKAFVHAVGLEPAMLIYLNGTQNFRGEPNENYARELLELFTMGPNGPDGPNYTEQDIQEIARALTGWVVDYYELSVSFASFLHDHDPKTIFGQSANFDYDSVIGLLFEQRADAIAHFIAGKLYQTFVYHVPDDAVVAALADVLLEHDFTLAPAVQTLLQSAHFFDEQVIGAQVKSPVDLLVGLMNETQTTSPPQAFELLNRFAYILEQRLFDPPNVAGWPGHHAWLTTTSLPIRWLMAEFLFSPQQLGFEVDLRPMVEQLLAVPITTVDEALAPLADVPEVFRLPVLLAQHLLAVPLPEVPIEPVDGDFVGNLEVNPIPQAVFDAPPYVRELALRFLGGRPWYEWDLYSSSAPLLLLAFMRYLTQLPEYQLR